MVFWLFLVFFFWFLPTNLHFTQHIIYFWSQGDACLKGDVWATSLQKMGIVAQVVWEIWPENEGGIIFARDENRVIMTKKCENTLQKNYFWGT